MLSGMIDLSRIGISPLIAAEGYLTSVWVLDPSSCGAQCLARPGTVRCI